MRKLKILTLVSLIAGAALMSVGCSKSNNNSSSNKDSVMYSAWQSFNMKYEGQDNNNDSVYDQTVTASSITQSILDKGSVVVYIADGSGDYANAADAGFSVTFGLGQIYISTFGAIPSGWTFRYVIIPGNISVTSQGSVRTYTPNQLKAMTYDQASGILDISNKPTL
ncbi:MAG: hypothetical protein JST42_01055 [Bacteroidetes bacterium]|nr:hypothetical protein [Bacteroidota bacterium]